VGVPGEFTTMSGRRLKLTIKQALQDAVSDNFIIFFLILMLFVKRVYGQQIVIL
jgi:hypothetical protein